MISIEHRYATLAGELGLDVTSVKPIGWSATTVPEATAAVYAGQLAELQAALVLWRRQEHRIGSGTRSHNLLAAACGCGRRIRVAKATLVEAPILCGLCEHPSSPQTQTRAAIDAYQAVAQTRGGSIVGHRPAAGCWRHRC